MPHLVLLGDSIFDNASYVPGRPPVIEQLRRALSTDWRATLLAVDGHVIADVPRQLERLPEDATHLAVSVGGNDALGSSWILGQPVNSVAGGLTLLQEVRLGFREKYAAMLGAVLATGRHAAVCTVYDRVPGLEPAELAALSGFNEVILHEAFAARLAVVDLRLICNHASDFSHVSPIEPSAAGGLKISRVIAEWAAMHDVAAGRSVIYT